MEREKQQETDSAEKAAVFFDDFEKRET